MSRKKRKKKRRKKERKENKINATTIARRANSLTTTVSQLVSWCFEPSQPQRITSGLTTTTTIIEYSASRLQKTDRKRSQVTAEGYADTCAKEIFRRTRLITKTQLGMQRVFTTVQSHSISDQFKLVFFPTFLFPSRILSTARWHIVIIIRE